MNVAFVLSRFFPDTRDFVQAVAQSEGCTVSLIRGDEDVTDALRQMRYADRVWFEGVGELLPRLLERESSRWITEAVLRVGDDELARLPFPRAWELVSDIIVPSRAAAEVLCRAPRPLAGKRGVHVVRRDRRAELIGAADPLAGLNQLAQVLHTPPNDFRKSVWKWVVKIAPAVGERVLLLGRAPDEFVEYLTDCLGARVVTEVSDASGADTAIFWENLDKAGGGELVDRALACLRAGGAAVGVIPGSPNPTDMTLSAILRLFEGWSGWTCPMEVAQEGRAAIAAPALPPGPARRQVRVVGEWPLVSAVVPVYNDEQRVGRALDGLLRQTYPNLEIVVIDDGSTDGTRQAVGKYLTDPRVRYSYKPHTGRPGTRNAGVKNSSGAYIAWLDSDDEAAPNRILMQMRAVRDDPRIDILHSDGIFLRPNGTLKERRRYRQITPDEFPSLLMAGFSGTCPILNTSATIRRRLYDRIGLYDAEFFRCQDYDFYVRTAIAGDVVYRHIPVPLVTVHTAPSKPGAQQRALDIYLKLVDKLVEGCGLERLTDAKARDLHEKPELNVARMVLGLAILYEAPAGHALFARGDALIAEALDADDPHDRAGALNLLGSKAEYLGDAHQAELYYLRAVETCPALREANDNLKALRSARKEPPVERTTRQPEPL
jgi:hypothetical protein